MYYHVLLVCYQGLQEYINGVITWTMDHHLIMGVNHLSVEESLSMEETCFKMKTKIEKNGKVLLTKKAINMAAIIDPLHKGIT